MNAPQKNVVSVAVGNDYYYSLTKNLILSFLKYNNPKDITFQLLTDNPKAFSQFETIDGVRIIELENLKKEEKSFTSKFRLAEYILADQNLFIDCDCIVYKSLQGVFEKFSGHDFSVVGEKKYEGDFFGSIQKIRSRFGINYLPHFVGSIYYYTNTDTSKKVFKKAMELKAYYDEIGLIRLRGKENEEPLLAIAMALYQQEPILEDGSVKADCMYFDKCETNVYTGKLTLHAKTYKNGYLKFDPAIVHFNDSFSERSSYKCDSYRLQKGLNISIFTEIYLFFRFTALEISISKLKAIFRPTYHFLVGPSKVKVSKRISANS